MAKQRSIVSVLGLSIVVLSAVLAIWFVVYEAAREALADPLFAPEHKMSCEQVDIAIRRCENNEVVCYLSNGISCFDKLITD